MIGRIRVSWRLARATMLVLGQNSDLLIFPIVGLLAFAFVIALLAGGILMLVDFQIGVLLQAPVWMQLAATFMLYLIGYFIVFSANTAMIGAAMQLLDGKQTTLADGWRIAYTHRKAIFVYALLMATVGLFLRLLSRWIGTPGSFALSVARRVGSFAILNLAWHVVPVLVIPVLVVEQLDPLAAIRRSSQLVTQRWGEGVVQRANVWFIFVLPMLLTIVAGIAAVVWINQSVQEIWVTTILYVVVMLIVTMFLLATGLNDIFSAVTYRYTCAMPITPPFEQEMLSQSFRAQPSRLLHFLRRFWNKPAKQPVGNLANTGDMAEVVCSESDSWKGS